ncbi:hypothetical protein INT47_008471 [Mucor saturninus]|uniref:T6SS Phospholipase effector Tle1-like catalytic domain-containing protein n=1 Tax=Mucor saturninus TaxID=64648 RepID=A0A8H7R9T2_9FUNG|nr:hypothetical protein INT47_008471 [Mucor saturninus]
MLTLAHRRRRIIVCLDGTWETPQEKTNVYKFYASLDSTTDQTWDYKISYCPGLGTKGNYPLLGGLFGYGITDQILSAYQYICKNYRNENDEIWLVGFSRGAYAARSLTGLIYNVGLLPENQLHHSKDAYQHYRNRGDASRPGELLSLEFRTKFNCRMPSIHFLACFDTVGSLGVPKLPWYLGGSACLHEFHDTKLSPIVKNAYHAVSIHEQREWFRPTLMQISAAGDQQVLEQVWFPGMHSDVGGQQSGPYDNVLSSQSLHWIMTKAIQNGLVFKPHCPINTQFIYHDSYTSSLIYRLMPRQDRSIERDVITNNFCLSQLFKAGKFDYMTQEQLGLYRSKTLPNFYSCIQQQNKLS